MPITAPDQNASVQEWDNFFEGHGEPKLRLLMQNGGWPQSLHLKTVEWLARRDQDVSIRQEASQVEQIDIARSSKDAAWASAKAAERAAAAAEAANTRATTALIVAIVSIIITVVGLWLVHWDATHGH